MSDPDAETAAGTDALGESAQREKEFTAQVASSVIFVSHLDRSVEFYRDVFACEMTIHENDAALLVAPGGFQLYLMARGDREQHPTGGIGHGFLMWAVDTAEVLEHFAKALRDCGHYVDTHTSDGVQFVEGFDPDHIRVVIAHPSPQQRPRSVLDARFYN